MPESIIDNQQYIASNDIQKFLSNYGFTSHFTVLSSHVRSISNPLILSKLESLLYFLKIKPSIIPITETWFKPNQPGMYNNLFDYTFVWNPRLEFKGVGVGMYNNKLFSFTLRNDLCIMNENNHWIIIHRNWIQQI